jgi:hypothetical protein
MDSVRFRTSWTLDELRSENLKLGEAEPDTAPFTYVPSLKRGGGDSAVAVMAFYGATAWPTLRPLNRQSVISSWAAVVAAVVASAPDCCL